MTRYAPPPPEPPRIERRRIPGGLAGTRRTAAHVARLIREGAGDFYVRQKAIDILLARRVAPKDYVGEIDALFRWVQRNVRYTKDPFRIEVLHAPRRMLQLRAGDCDDMTILLGALVKSVGHPVRIVLTGPDARRPDLFSHIYLEARHQADWIPLDATMPYSMGWSPRTPVRLVLPVEEESTDDRPASRAAPSPPAHATPDVRAGARLAPGSAARDTSRGSAAARPARAGPVGTTAQAPTPAAKPLAQGEPSLRLAERTRQAAPASHHAAHPGAPAQLGSAWGAATATSGDRWCGGIGAGTPPHAATAAGDVTPRSGGAAAPAGAATPSAAAAGVAGPRSLSGVVRDASVLYRRFSRLPAHSLRRVAHQRVIPPVVVELGHLTGLVYRSDKWVGRPRTYIHYMEDPPRLVSDVAGRRLFLVGGSYRVTARGIEG